MFSTTGKEDTRSYQTESQSFGALICTTPILQEDFDVGKYDRFNAHKYGCTKWWNDNLWMFTSEIEARCPIQLYDFVFRWVAQPPTGRKPQ